MFHLKHFKILVWCLCWTIWLSGSCFGKDLGNVGRVYSIIEKDALTELEDRAKKVDWKSIIGKVKPEKYRPEDLVPLPRSRHNEKRLVDMTYELEMDVLDGNGDVLFPKGYKINPLDYLTTDRILVVIDGEDPEQLSWFKSSSYWSDIRVRLLISNGSFFDLSKRLKRQVYYATEPLIARYQLRVVPSVVKTKGKVIEVEEIAFKLPKGEVR